MQIIYLHNFRGFRKTFIELSQINFFVGENSSGKTSVLNIITLLSRSRFWFSYDFTDEGIEMGLFDDLLSHNADSKYFTIGFYSENPEMPIKKYMILLKFANLEGFPVLAEQIIFEDNIIFYFKRIGQKVKYRIDSFRATDENNLFSELITFSESILCKRKMKIAHADPKEFIQTPAAIVGKIDKELGNKWSNIIPTEFLSTNGISNIAPIRAKPQSIYTARRPIFNPEGEHSPFLLKSLLEARVHSKNLDDTIQNNLKAIMDYGKESGLFDNIELKVYGKGSNIPFEIDLIRGGYSYRISSVGYGVSQILPLLVESMFVSENDWISIQQPEVHLHPKAQSALGQALFDISNNFKINFIIETHSDYLIDRYRVALKNSESKLPTKLFFFSHSEGINKIEVINIDSNGKYIETLPKKYRDFFINEAFETMDV